MLPTPTYHEEIKHGMAWLLDHVPYYGRWYRFWQFWIAAEGRLPLVDVDEGWEHPISVGRANERLRQECVAHIESQLSDRPDLLAKATPNYAPGSKRLVRDNGVWLRALKQPHVSLVTERIERMVEDGIVAANGEFHPADVVVFATGFHASEFLCPITITGRHGKDLHRWWGGDSRAYLGITVPGFPNLFMLGGPNTASVINGSAYFASECAAEYTLSAIKLLLGGKHRGMDCREEAFLAHNRHVDAGNLRKAWGSPKVASTWYRNSFGRASVPWPFPLLEYWNLTSSVNMADYEFL
jgi:4-hydroxyacetophenone monooxygenase